ncbi:hypothetical protein C8R46DRAFT_1270357 [Mycena filopes]|nr:hypothetical protein C8R46DRAFT_1270357 [Mycena filopes]
MPKTQTPQAGKIVSLPNGILTQILLRGAELILPPNSTDVVPFPTIASQVCHLWRELALATPALWTTIRISGDLLSIQVAYLYTVRAQDHLLDITITLPAGNPHNVDRFALALDVLGPHLARWRTLALHVEEPELKYLSASLEDMNPAEFMQLKYLHLDTGMARLAVPRLPGLRGLRLQYAQALAFQHRWGLGAEFLHTLDISAMDFMCDKIRLSPERMPQLTTLVLREFPWQTPSRGLQVDFPTIRSLAVQFICCLPQSLEVLTTWVKLPGLEYLELKNMFFESVYEEPTRAEVPLAWEEPQFPSLHTLRLVDTKLTPRRLALLEILCPDITTVELVNVSGTDTLPTVYAHNTFGSIHNLHSVEPADREDNPPWPSLHTLRVDSATFGRWVEQFAERRSLLGPNRGLTSLALTPEPERDGLPVSLTAILDRAPFSTCSLLEGFIHPFFEDGSDFQVTHASQEDGAYEDEDTDYSEGGEPADYDYYDDYDDGAIYYLFNPKRLHNSSEYHEDFPDAGWDDSRTQWRCTEAYCEECEAREQRNVARCRGEEELDADVAASFQDPGPSIRRKGGQRDGKRRTRKKPQSVGGKRRFKDRKAGIDLEDFFVA